MCLVLGTANAAVLEQAPKLAGVRKVLHANAEHLSHPRAEDAAKLLQSLAADYSVVLAPHTSQAKNILPRFAALQDVGMISEALEINAPNNYVRPDLRRQSARYRGQQARTASADRACLALEAGCG